MYRDGIARLSRILRGRTPSLMRELKSAMRDASAGQNFERAAGLRDEIEKLENVFRHRMVLEAAPAKNQAHRHIERALRQLFGKAQLIRRAEAYDISNISGTAATGSMVVFMDGAPAKSEYRIFNIKTVHRASDVDMMKEVFERRLVHTEWPYPDLIVIDGGKPQLNAALPVILRHGFSGAVSALAKREEELYIAGRGQPLRLDTLPMPVMHFFQRIRDEAHRFAKKQHHILRKKAYAQK